MPLRCSSSLRNWSLLLIPALVAGCGTPVNRAPVEQRQAGVPPKPAPSARPDQPLPPGMRPALPDPNAATKPPPPGIENAGKPGYYSVKPGDTLVRIALEHSRSWRELVAWNGLENPNLIEVGQVLRVVPPGVDPSVTAQGVGSGQVLSRPLDGAAGAASAPASVPPVPPSAASAAAPAASTAAAVAAVLEAKREVDGILWSWPSGGNVLANFKEGTTKGLDIAGASGDRVLAAADGRVVYSGSGLRGLGNLVIVKHNDTYLTAYAHNRVNLVAEDQPVKRGEQIAEMGDTDAERVQLHFEVRRKGKPVDPRQVLPER